MTATASPKKKDSSQGEKKKPAPVVAPAGGPDIRNFFSQGSSNGGPSKPVVKTPTTSKGSGKQPITIDDSDEEEVKPKATTSKHFQGSSTTKRPIAIASSSSPEPEPEMETKPKPQVASSSKSTPQPKPQAKRVDTPSTAGKSKPPTSSSNGKRKVVKQDPDDDDDDDDDLEDIKPARKRQSVGGSTSRTKTKPATKKVNYLEESDSDDDEESEEVEVKPAAKAKAKVPTKGKAAKKEKEPSPMDLDDESEESDDFIDDDDDEDDQPKKGKGKKAAAAPKKTTPKKSAPTKKAVPAKKATPKKKDEDEAGDGGGDAEIKEEKPKPKFNWAAAQAAKKAGPKAPGSKEIPEGAPDCLAGLTFVFTGELESLGRDEASELVKRYSGKVTGAPSSKTSYVVVGENAGAAKLEKIKKLSIKTLNEDQFLELIGTRGGGELDEKQQKAKEKEEKKILEQAKEMEAREKEEEKLQKRKLAALSGTGMPAKKISPLSAQLWTTKYAPTNLKEVCGNKTNIERLGVWLQEWEKSYKVNFKKPGKDGMGIYRAVLISGPPGIGKTTSAHLMAKQAGYSPLELNASDARSKKLIENSTNIDNTSLDGFFQGSGLKTTNIADMPISSKTCLIMDEVDGMSAGDRGGVGALNGLIKKTKIPLILICNDRTLQKMKPLQSTTFNMTFRRPGPAEVRSRIMSILFKEKMKIPPNVVDELIKGTNSDIRQVLNMLSTFKLGQSEMNFDQSKDLLKINEKNTIMTPFTIIDKLCSPYAFSRTNRDTLNDKMELYFHDFSFVPLFMQEHYLKTNPARLQNDEGPIRNLKNLELVSSAADWISDGDLVDRMIHGSEQHWSLLPFHAVTSTVAPAYHIYGSMRSQGGGFGGGGWGPSFPQWLGQNSKQGKLGRQLTDIQIRMRLRVSGSRQEIRETYMPMLASKIVLPLVKNGQDAVEEVISYMDEYYLGKEDWDAFVELGVDEMKEDLILKKIPTAVKSAFTRQYNKADHPIAFHKGDMFASAKKKIADVGPAPDNEDVFEEDEPVPDEPSDRGEDGDEGDDDEGVNDLSKDKLIKAVKPKGAGKGKAKDKDVKPKGRK